MTIADAISIKQLNPFIIITLANIFLKEKIIPKQIPVLILAFLGALLISIRLIFKSKLALDIGLNYVSRS